MFHFYNNYWSIAFAALILRDSSVLLQPYFFWPSHILLIYRIIARSLSFSLVSFSRDATSVCGRGIGAQQFRVFVMSKIHHLRPWWYKFQFSFVESDRWPSQKSGMCQENRNTLNSLELFQTIPGNWGYLWFWVFIRQQNLPLAIGKLQIFLTDMTPRLYSFLRWNFKCSSFTPEKNLSKIYTAQRVKWIIQHLTSFNVVYSVQ